MNNINDLRSELFATLKALRDPEKPMDPDRAKAVAEVAGKIIDSAKVEVAFLEVTGAADSTGFIPTPTRDLAAPSQVALNGLAPLRPARRQ
jgi:hypothetical protein